MSDEKKHRLGICQFINVELVDGEIRAVDNNGDVWRIIMKDDRQVVVELFGYQYAAYDE